MSYDTGPAEAGMGILGAGASGIYVIPDNLYASFVEHVFSVVKSTSGVLIS
jgi:hypothetical protein